MAQPSWPGQIALLAPERDLSARVVRVLPDPARGHTWVLSYAMVAEDVAPRFALRRYDRAGNAVWSSIDSEPFRAGVEAIGGAIGDVAVHDDGSVSVLVLTPYGPFQPKYGPWSTLSFLRLDPEGNVLRTAPLAAPLETEQPAWCTLALGTYTCRLEEVDDVPNAGVWLGASPERGTGCPLSNQLLADGDGLLLLRAAEGYRLQRLDAAYRVIADAVVVPSTEEPDALLFGAEPLPRIARDGAGHVVVMHTAKESLLDVLAAADGPRLSLSALTGGDPARDDGVLLQYFDDATLRRVAVHLLSPPEAMRPAALVADGEEVVAVLNFNPSNIELPFNRKRDVVLLRSRISGAAPHYQRFDVANSDVVSDALVLSGRVWLTGITNDGRGLAQAAEGLVTSINRDGDVGPVLRLIGPRSVQVDTLAEDGAGRLLIGGVADVSSLDACASMTSRCQARAFVGALPTPEPSVLTHAELAPLPSASWRAPPE